MKKCTPFFIAILVFANLIAHTGLQRELILAAQTGQYYTIHLLRPLLWANDIAAINTAIKEAEARNFQVTTLLLKEILENLPRYPQELSDDNYPCIAEQANDGSIPLDTNRND